MHERPRRLMLRAAPIRERHPLASVARTSYRPIVCLLDATRSGSDVPTASQLAQGG